LTVNKEVKTPEDLAGLKIRVPESPVFVKSWERLGAAPTPMAFGEVFTSLQQGVIDGQENPLSLIYNSKFNEVVKFLVKTEHVREPITVVISESKFKSLSPELQEALVNAANGEGKTFANNEVTNGDSEFLKKLQEGGMTLVEPDLAAFQAKLDGFVDAEFPGVKDIFEKIRAAK
jgi:TRAP-type C4-dicarboxylate transport system substrate-binding protein